ncbi:intraflagellar transport complex B protein 46 C terminal-domain-containing protein, partial [Blyttiomyces helicus]
TVKMQMQELFTFVSTYQPETLELSSELKCFIPEFIPAIGDIDPMIKMPFLGLVVLDEPSTKQSEPAVLDLQLRALHKSTKTPAIQQVRSIQLSTGMSASSMSTSTGQKALAQWVESVRDYNSHKPPDRVEYSKRMPDIEQLMAEWPPEIDRTLTDGEINLPSAEIDLSLPDYSRLICNILDIPVYHTQETAANTLRSARDAKTKGPRLKTSRHAHVESLHVLFTLYSEFKNSQHFGRGFERDGAVGGGVGVGVGGTGSGTVAGGGAGGGGEFGAGDILKLW